MSGLILSTPAWRPGELLANGIRLHYTRSGGARPAMVLAHGLTDDGPCWTAVADQLADGYDVVRLDARGHGGSEAPEQGYGPVENAGDLAGLIAGLGLRQPIVLGHSMGAVTALVLAGRSPELPRAILLEDPPPRWMDVPEDNTAWQAVWRTWILSLKAKTRQQIMADKRLESPSWPEADLGPWADAKLKFNLNALNRDSAAALDWPAMLRRITCPALLITAVSERGALVTPEAAAAMQQLMPQLRVAHIAGAGHNIRREQYAAYMDAVRGFLKPL